MTTGLADRFGRIATFVALAGLLAAVGIAVFHRETPDQGPTVTYAELAPADPVRVSLGKAGGTAPVLSTDVPPETSLLGSPVDAALVTWWQDSAQPGATSGQTVLSAHTKASKGGLSGIGSLEPDDFVDVLTRAGTMRYRIDRVRSYTEQSYPGVADSLYNQDGGSGGLVLVSAQEWDGVDYQKLVVATGVPLGQPS